MIALDSVMLVSPDPITSVPDLVVIAIDVGLGRSPGSASKPAVSLTTGTRDAECEG